MGHARKRRAGSNCEVPAIPLEIERDGSLMSSGMPTQADVPPTPESQFGADPGFVSAESSPGDADSQGYLNADQRTVAIADNGKPSFTIDRAALQLTGFDPVTMQPAPGWSSSAGVPFTVTYGFRASAPFQ